MSASENYFAPASPTCGIYYPHLVAAARYAVLIRIKFPQTGTAATKSLFRHALELPVGISVYGDKAIGHDPVRTIDLFSLHYLHCVGGKSHF